MKEHIIELLTKEEVDFSIEKKGDVDSIFFTAKLENGTIRGFIAAHNQEDRVMIHVGHPTTIPLDKRQKICELIARINYDDIMGAFVIDLNDGYMGYQSGFYFEKGSEFAKLALIKHFEVSYCRLDYYLPVILGVAFGDKEPDQALNELVHQLDPRLN